MFLPQWRLSVRNLVNAITKQSQQKQRQFILKRYVAEYLRYRPLLETAPIREAIEKMRLPGYPYCHPEEGDLLYLLLQEIEGEACLEMGFHTGSTALYMANAVAARDGRVTSVCLDVGKDATRGKKLLSDNGFSARHRLIQINSNRAVPELFLANEKFDFIFMDGWKTLDHLMMELYYINQMLCTGGAIVFDDSFMPSVRAAIRLLKRYYGYTEVDYKMYRQTKKLRLFQILTSRTLYRPYRALIKSVDTEAQKPIRDWHFYRPV